MLIELKPHVGKHLVSGKPVPFQQDVIFADGQQVGYVGWQANAPINLIVPDPDDSLKAAVREAVQAKHGGTEDRRLASPIALPEDAVQDADSDELD